MTKIATERPHPMRAKGSDPTCTTCRPDQPGRVRADRVWAWSLAHPGVPVFR